MSETKMGVFSTQNGKVAINIQTVAEILIEALNSMKRSSHLSEVLVKGNQPSEQLVKALGFILKVSNSAPHTESIDGILLSEYKVPDEVAALVAPAEVKIDVSDESARNVLTNLEGREAILSYPEFRDVVEALFRSVGAVPQLTTAINSKHTTVSINDVGGRAMNDDGFVQYNSGPRFMPLYLDVNLYKSYHWNYPADEMVSNFIRDWLHSLAR